MSVEQERHGAVLVVRLNRPEAANALDAATASGIAAGFSEAAGDDGIRAVVLTGAGDRVFCAGMDLKAFADGQDNSTIGPDLDTIEACPKPVIAAVNGTAVAGGFELVLRCDLVVAAEHAKFGIPEVRRGLVAAGGGTRLPLRVPLAVALELGLTGDTIDAARALALGLVNRVVPGPAVLDEALALAARISENGPLAVQATKRLMHAEVPATDIDRIRREVAPVFASEDAMEGARAFAEKRAPNWTGR